jgi:SAM-dependent methyltransferase
VSFEFEARFFCAMLARSGAKPKRILVVGCGDGTEAEHIARETGAQVTGIDLHVDARFRRAGVELMRGDARVLPFRDGTFDALYCYHVIEHVPGPERAIRECSRVLMPGAVAFFGTPNRARLVGYLGGRATSWQKVKWNLVDWGRRLTGQWRNETGAHAGFSDGELSRLLAGSFPRVESVSLLYYVGKYPRLEGAWKASFQLGVGQFFAPSVYFRVLNGGPGPGR